MEKSAHCQQHEAGSALITQVIIDYIKMKTHPEENVLQLALMDKYKMKVPEQDRDGEEMIIDKKAGDHYNNIWKLNGDEE